MTVPLVSSALELRSAFVLMQTSNCQPHTGEVDDVDDDDELMIYLYYMCFKKSSLRASEGRSQTLLRPALA